jgi:hypothetical protein
MVFATDYPQNFNSADPKIGKNIDGIRDYIETIRDIFGGTAARLLNIGV